MTDAISLTNNLERIISPIIDAAGTLIFQTTAADVRTVSTPSANARATLRPSSSRFGKAFCAPLRSYPRNLVVCRTRGPLRPGRKLAASLGGAREWVPTAKTQPKREMAGRLR